MRIRRLVAAPAARSLASSIAGIIGICAFLYSWWWCYDQHGYLLGFGFGWVPSAIAGVATFISVWFSITVLLSVLAVAYRPALRLKAPFRHLYVAILTASLVIFAAWIISCATRSGLLHHTPAVQQPMSNPPSGPGPLTPPSALMDSGGDEGEAGPEDPA